MKNNIYQVKYGTNDEFDIDTISAPSEKEAIDHCVEYNGISDGEILECVEIPESEWDNYRAKIWEDNDLSKEPFLSTYRELHCEQGIEIISSTNIDWL